MFISENSFPKSYAEGTNMFDLISEGIEDLTRFINAEDSKLKVEFKAILQSTKAAGGEMELKIINSFLDRFTLFSRTCLVKYCHLKYGLCITNQVRKKETKYLMTNEEKLPYLDLLESDMNCPTSLQEEGSKKYFSVSKCCYRWLEELLFLEPGSEPFRPLRKCLVRVSSFFIDSSL